MWQLLSRICGWKSEAGSIKVPAIPTSNGQSRPNKALHRTLDSAGELWRQHMYYHASVRLSATLGLKSEEDGSARKARTKPS